MPAKSKLLGFNCPTCRRDYGSIQSLKQKRKEIKRKERRILSKRNEVEAIRIPKRSTLFPGEYALKNKILAERKERLLEKMTKGMAQLKREGWRFLPFSQPLPESERQKLEEYVAKLKERVETRNRQIQIEEGIVEASRWNAIENVRDIDSHVYDIMKTVGEGFITTEDVKDNQEGEQKGNCIIKWNPITIIKRYRQFVDPLRHLNFKINFYAKVLAKYPGILTRLLSGEREQILTKAFNVVDTYRKQFSNRNWRYTWFEWFWIVRYAQAFTPRRAAKMLLALDGEEGRISPKHIKDQIKPVLKFWEDFIYYCRYFFKFRKLIIHLIKMDPELTEEYQKILQQNEKNNNIYVKKILEEHFERMEQKQHDVDRSNDVNNDHFKVSTVGPERIRIHHSNPNYQREKDEFNNGLRKEKPKRKKSCTFSPSLLPIDVRIKLHKELKVPII